MAHAFGVGHFFSHKPAIGHGFSFLMRTLSKRGHSVGTPQQRPTPSPAHHTDADNPATDHDSIPHTTTTRGRSLPAHTIPGCSTPNRVQREAANQQFRAHAASARHYLPGASR